MSKFRGIQNEVYCERDAVKAGFFILLVAGFLVGRSAYAQDAAIPKPKPRVRSSSAPPKPADQTERYSSAPSLLLLCDLACDWNLDGGLAKGHIGAGESAKVRVDLGQHQVIATASGCQDEVKQIVEVKPGGQILVSLELKSLRDTREEREENAKPTWTDTTTSLMWAKQDDGSDVTWQQATDYCQNLRLGGHDDWRLATIDELQGIYDAGTNVAGQLGGRSITTHVKGNLQLSGGTWSSSQRTASGEAWLFGFGGGGRYSSRLGHSFHDRALCVRRSGE